MMAEAPENPGPLDEPDPEQRYEIRRLCLCEDCGGTGKAAGGRCPECRGEGRTLGFVAACGSPEALGATLVWLAHEGEFEGCPIGILDRLGEPGQKWLVRPWLPSTRNVSDAGRIMAYVRHGRKEVQTGS